MLRKTLTAITLIAAVVSSAFAETGERKTGQPPKGSVTIFNNIGTGNTAYDCCSGYAVVGPVDSGFPGEGWIAAAFTPDSDRIVTEIDVAASYNGSGKNKMRLSLYSDNGGVPGAVLGSWELQDLTTFQTCCAVAIKKGKNRLSVSVKAGTQYWVVLSEGKNKSLSGAWNWNTTDTTDANPAVESWCSTSDGGFCGPFNNVWTPLSGTMPAFAVFGK
jgi:hypothetical protein